MWHNIPIPTEQKSLSDIDNKISLDSKANTFFSDIAAINIPTYLPKPICSLAGDYSQHESCYLDSDVHEILKWLFKNRYQNILWKIFFI